MQTRIQFPDAPYDRTTQSLGLGSVFCAFMVARYLLCMLSVYHLHLNTTLLKIVHLPLLDLSGLLKNRNHDLNVKINLEFVEGFRIRCTLCSLIWV